MLTLLLAIAPLLSCPQAPPPAAKPAGKIPWFEKDLDAALKEAKAQQKLVLAYFHSAAVPASAKLSQEAFSEDRVADALKDVICVRVDTEKQHDVAVRYNVQDPPVLVWFNSDGTVRDRIFGYKDTNTVLGDISRVKVDVGTINELRRTIAAKGDDIESRFQLYKRLRDLGDIAGASEQKAAILKLDPQGTSRASHHFTYDRITGEIEQYWAQTGTLHMHKVEELQTFVELESDPELIWDGWMRLANTHAYLANQSASKGMFADAKEHRMTRRKFIANAWRGVPQADLDFFHDWCTTNAGLFWNERDELTPEDKQFFSTITAKLVDVFSKDPLAHDLRARALFLAGKGPEAIDEAQKAVELDPSNDEYKNRLKQFRGG
jgi:hypothetical protein